MKKVRTRQDEQDKLAEERHSQMMTRTAESVESALRSAAERSCASLWVRRHSCLHPRRPDGRFYIGNDYVAVYECKRAVQALASRCGQTV